MGFLHRLTAVGNTDVALDHVASLVKEEDHITGFSLCTAHHYTVNPRVQLWNFGEQARAFASARKTLCVNGF